MARKCGKSNWIGKAALDQHQKIAQYSLLYSRWNWSVQNEIRTRLGCKPSQKSERFSWNGLHPKQGAYVPPELPDAEENEESGDEEEIERVMTKLIDDLEKGIQDDSKPQDERRRYLKKVKFYKIIFSLNKYYFDPYHLDHMLNS